MINYELEKISPDGREGWRYTIEHRLNGIEGVIRANIHLSEHSLKYIMAKRLLNKKIRDDIKRSINAISQIEHADQDLNKKRDRIVGLLNDLNLDNWREKLDECREIIN